MRRTFPQEPQFKRSTREGGRGHEATGEPSERSSSEEEEESADRGTGESRHWLDVECLTVEMETDCSSLGKLYGPGDKAGEGENPKINPHAGYSVMIQDKPTQKTLLSPLPSFLKSPTYKEVTGSPACRGTRIAPSAEQNGLTSATPPKVFPKKKGNFTSRESPHVVPKIPERAPEPSKIARPAGLLSPGGSQARPRSSTSKSPPEAPHRPTTRAGALGGTPPRRKAGGTSPLQAGAIPAIPTANVGDEGGGEVKEKLVYVVEEKGKNVTKVETDLFTVNEILTIKKDLVELSEFAKKLKKLKQSHRELGNERSEDGLCQCEPTAQILREVNKRIEALEMRQEEMEKESKFGNKRDAETGTQKAVEAKTSSSTLPKSPEKPESTDKSEPKKETSPNSHESCFPKPELFVSRADSFSKASDIFNELLDIKSQLQKFEQRSPLKASPEEVSLEEPANPPEKKNRPIAVFTSKTFILSPDNYGKKEAGIKVDEVNGLLKECSSKLEGIPAEGKDGEVEPKCRNCSRSLEERDLENQEPQKNRATEIDSKQVDLSKKESSSGQPSNGPSSGECFASPSGRFFAWVKKKSGGKPKGNVRPETRRPRVLQRALPRHRLSWSTSASSSLTEIFVEEPVRKAKRRNRGKRNPDPVLARVTRSRSAYELDSGICKRDRSPRKMRAKRGDRSLSKCKTHNDVVKAVDRREPRIIRRARHFESTTSSSFSVFLDTFDFEETSTSADRCRLQPRSVWNERIFSCGGDNVESRKKRTGREGEKARREGMREAREKKIKKAKKTEKQSKKRMPRRRKSGERNTRQQKKERGTSPHPESRDCFKIDSKDSLRIYKKFNEEKRKSDSSTEKPSDDRFSFKNFLKSFSWLYSRLGSVPFTGEYHEDKKEENEEKTRKELRNERLDRWEDYNDDAESDGSSRIDVEGAYPRHRLRRGHPEEPESDHKNCDCIRAYLESQMQRKLAALVRLQKSSGPTTEATSASESSNGDLAIARRQKVFRAKSEYQKDKRLHRKKRKHIKKKQQKYRRKRRYREDEPLCRKCRAPHTVLDGSGEKDAEKLNSFSENRFLKKEDRNKSDYSPILAFLYQFCRSRQRHSKGLTEVPVKKRQESKTCFILPEEEKERRRNKSRRFCCTRCGRKLKREIDPEDDGSDDQAWEYGKRSGSDESRHYENPSIATLPFDDENERKHKRKYGRGDKDAHWGREKRKRRKGKKYKNEGWPHDEVRQRDLATDCLFLRESLNYGMDRTSEAEDGMESSTSVEILRRKNLRDRLSSIHSLWKSLRRWREKGTQRGRRRLGTRPERSASKLDLTFSDERCKDDAWPRLERRPSASKKKLGCLKKALRNRKKDKKKRRKGE